MSHNSIVSGTKGNKKHYEMQQKS